MTEEIKPHNCTCGKPCSYQKVKELEIELEELRAELNNMGKGGGEG